MWGFYNERDRQLGKEIFKKIINEAIANKYHKAGTKTKKGPDQFFLTDHVYPLIKSQSIIHDSYLCQHYRDSKPFPTQRIGNCFIGSPQKNQANCELKKFIECPIDCRPIEHRNWNFC